MRLPTPEFDPSDTEAALAWVGEHLGSLHAGPLRASAAFTGGQAAADAALATFDVAGYAARRNEVYPRSRRGASGLSPFIRHGLLTLPRVWHEVAGGPARDVAKFRDELLWQEYARHLYARLGSRTAAPLRYEPPTTPRGAGPHDLAEVAAGPGGTLGQGSDRPPIGGAGDANGRPIGGAGDANGRPIGGAGHAEQSPHRMACLSLVAEELVRDGWLPNQTRMWFASHWTVRRGWDWHAGEDAFFAHLLDGSRAANRLGWQWTVGTGTGRPYGFSRSQVVKRAPGVCATCALRDNSPIERWPSGEPGPAVPPEPLLRADPDVARTAGPREPQIAGEPEQVWLTAESLGDDDPALAAHPELPVVFVLDEPLLGRLRLTAPRLVFLAQCLADLGAERELEVRLGAPVAELAGRALATTFAPVPGWRRRAAALLPVAVHPWPWLRQPGAGSLASFSAWVRSTAASRR